MSPVSPTIPEHPADHQAPAPPRARQPRSLRWPIWILAVILGSALGASSYVYVRPLRRTFDYWLGLMS